MYLNTDYQQSVSLLAQNGQTVKNFSKTYQSFLSHNNFYSKNCFLLMYNEKTSQGKSNNSCLRLDDSVSGHKLNHERCGKRFHIFEHNIINSGAKREKRWRCPYCYNWWPIGQKCQNKNCPTNQW